MKKQLTLLILTISTALASGQQTQEPIPKVDVRINDTEYSKDDYIGTSSFVSCTIRLTNGNDFPSLTSLPVRLRNIPFLPSSQGQLQFSNTASGTGSSSLSFNLPINNTPFTFYIRGTRASQVDKDAIIEVVDNRRTDIKPVISRKALMVTNSNELPASQPQVLVQINDVNNSSKSTLDDYLIWSPTPCSITYLNGAGMGNLTVTISNADIGDPRYSGSVFFAPGSMSAGFPRGNSLTFTASLLMIKGGWLPVGLGIVTSKNCSFIS